MTYERLERAFYLGLTVCVLLTAYGSASSRFELPGPRYNMSASMPRGWYWFTPGSVKRGAVVGACLPHSLATYALAHDILLPSTHPCETGVEPIVKTVAAVGGDVVTITDAGVSINGDRWPMSAPRRFVERCQRNGRYVIASDQVFLLGLHPRSWDGRVWGAVPRSSILGSWKPIYTE
jgi:conjugative transfer signal peptidase TraF